MSSCQESYGVICPKHHLVTARVMFENMKNRQRRRAAQPFSGQAALRWRAHCMRRRSSTTSSVMKKTCLPRCARRLTLAPDTLCLLGCPLVGSLELRELLLGERRIVAQRAPAEHGQLLEGLRLVTLDSHPDRVQVPPTEGPVLEPGDHALLLVQHLPRVSGQGTSTPEASRLRDAVQLSWGVSRHDALLAGHWSGCSK